MNKFEREGYVFQTIPQEEVSSLLGELKEVSDAWLSNKNTREKGIWEPKYMASPGGLFVPRILANVASLVSGGLKGLVAK